MDNNWISVEDRTPSHGQNVIGYGTWMGEVYGRGEDGFICIGEWKGGRTISIDSDTYSTEICDVTHWMPSPNAPS